VSAHWLCLCALALAPQDSEEPPAFWTVVERAAHNAGAADELDAVLEHMRGIPARRAKVTNRLSRVELGLTEPWRPPALADELRTLLAAPVDGGDFAGLIAGVAGWLDIDALEGEDEELRLLDQQWARIVDTEDGGLEGLALLEALSTYLGRAHRALDESLAGLEPGDWPLLFEGHADFAEAWYRTHFPDAEPSAEQREHLEAFMSGLLLRPKTDRRRMQGVADALLRLAQPDFVRGLPRRLAKVKTEVDTNTWGADVRAVVGDEPSCRVILSGRRSSVHAAPAALVIDLGGADRYERAAVVDTPDGLASVVIDLGGNDTYAGDGPGPAYSAAGVALLLDREGDDRYTSGRLGQAASALGAAFLIDLEGDDEYVAQDYAQGHALCGVALLYDLAGDDAYTAWAVAQGGGIGYGLSALVDADGDDSYLADLVWPDVYGDSGPEIYHGASQGYCTGIRTEVAGGIGALLDLGDGKDRYQSGNFSQGGGYYFSFGLLYDGGGDDENFGTRYSQGFGVHQAIGVRRDAGGNDTYTCRSVAHTGMAWDEGVGYLLEDGGDDTYSVGALGCGGAAQTGVAVCIDRDGVDSYLTGHQSQGGTGGSDYHDKPSLGVLLDLGGDRDTYSATERANDTLHVSASVGVFLDTKARDAATALKSKALRERSREPVRSR
jgi:hypothetical protein